jgi:hypothetical protein
MIVGRQLIGTLVPGNQRCGMWSAGVGPSPLVFGDMAGYGDRASGEVRTLILPNA